MRHRLPVPLLLIALAAATGTLSAADLRGVRLIDDGQGTRAVVEIDSLAGYKVFTLANPDRLVVDLGQARLVPGFRAPGPNGAVAGVRTGKPTPDTLRLVFDLGAPVLADSRIEREGNLSRLTLVLSADSTSKPAAIAVASTNTAPAPIAAPPLDPIAPPTLDFAVAPPRAESMMAPMIESLRLDSNLQPPASSQAREAPVAAAVPPLQPQSPAVKPARTVRDVLGNGERRLVVAIDAGHGGKDPGALGPTGVREKVVTLAVAKELARQINADPGMRALLIRDRDQFVPLKQRYMKARAAQADLFISIHADAALNDSASGASVYVLSTRGASSQAARWLADQENAADLVGGVSLDHKDPNLAAVLLDLSQSATMRASDDIATSVLGALKNVGKAHKPSIERANFVVLRSPDVPSMLVETGFITNPGEEQRLNDPGYRTRLATAIASGVRKYFVEQAPPGSWYAARRGEAPTSGGTELVAAAPE
jgi:N-acetylmuramoyl-L-alanine amidase